jgi:hypothetical protein
LTVSFPSLTFREAGWKSEVPYAELVSTFEYKRYAALHPNENFAHPPPVKKKKTPANKSNKTEATVGAELYPNQSSDASAKKERNKSARKLKDTDSFVPEESEEKNYFVPQEYAKEVETRSKSKKAKKF